MIRLAALLLPSYYHPAGLTNIDNSPGIIERATYSVGSNGNRFSFRCQLAQTSVSEDRSAKHLHFDR
ncbi:MAG TPA: hypothetical protein VHU83_07515 [Bryobacteraceae bacterium]|nr:hypothetical protein [Bryobacteraceae bacterium]